MIPVDDDEFPSEAFTAGWEQEEPDVEAGFEYWDSDESEDAADSEATDLDDVGVPSGEFLIARSDVDYGTPVYPDHKLRREHHACKVWGLYSVMSEPDGDWRPELVTQEA